jgi:ABC-type transport system involved in multi-copper enzyme maturation permease subunit
MGVCASAFSANVAKATLWAYGGAVLFPILEMPSVLWVAHEVLGLGVPETTLLAHNPFFATAMTIFGWRTLVTSPAVLVQPAIFVLGLSAIALLAASRRMAREFAVTAGGRKGRTPVALRFEDPVRSRATPRTIVIPTDLRSLGVLVVMTLPMLIPILASRWDDDEIVVGMFIATWLTTIYLLVRASQTIAPERQRGSLGLLLATPVTARHFVDAQFAGLFCHAARLLFPAFAVGALGVADGEIRFGQFAAWCFATAVLVGIHIAVGIWRSAAATTGGRAAASAISAVFVTSIVWGLVALAVTWLANKTGVHEESAGIPIVAMIPAAWHGMLVGMAGERSWNRDESLAFWWSLVFCLATIRACFVLRRRAHLALAGDVA